MEQETNLGNTNEEPSFAELERNAVKQAKERAHEVVKIVAAVGAILISIGIAYGTLTAKTDSLDKRINIVEEHARDRDEYIQKDLDHIKGKLDNIERYLRDGSGRPLNPTGGGK